MKRVLIFCLLISGCGGGSGSSPTSTPTPIPNATVSGQYNILLTSSAGHAPTNVYTNFSQTGANFTGDPNTLVCASNDPTQCEGDDAPAITITPTGTVNGNNLTMSVTFPSPSGNITANFTGTVSGTSLSGTYTAGSDSGSWTGSPASSLSGNYSGTLQSNANPVIAPTLLVTLTQDSSFNITGNAMLMNSCLSTISLSGKAIGGAMELTSPSLANSVIVALPERGHLKFSYAFGSSGSCAGDSGTGTVTKQ